MRIIRKRRVRVNEVYSPISIGSRQGLANFCIDKQGSLEENNFIADGSGCSKGEKRMILDFIRNKIVEVEPLSDGSLTVFWRLKDSLLEVNVELKVQPPDLEITEAKAQIKRLPHKKCLSCPELMEKVKGLRVGPGLRKIVRGLLGGSEGCQVLTQAVLECSNAVILHFTRYTLQPADDLDDNKKIAGARAMLEGNPRMAGSCVVFADDSPVVMGLNE